jgi:hypothetical protein
MHPELSKQVNRIFIKFSVCRQSASFNSGEFDAAA